MVSQTEYNFQKPHAKTDLGNGRFWPETWSVFGKRELAHSLLSLENRATHHQQDLLGIPSPPPPQPQPLPLSEEKFDRAIGSRTFTAKNHIMIQFVCLFVCFLPGRIFQEKR